MSAWGSLRRFQRPADNNYTLSGAEQLGSDVDAEELIAPRRWGRPAVEAYDARGGRVWCPSWRGSPKFIGPKKNKVARKSIAEHRDTFCRILSKPIPSSIRKPCLGRMDVR
jgi:hypothetical protein